MKQPVLKLTNDELENKENYKLYYVISIEFLKEHHNQINPIIIIRLKMN